MIEIGPMYLKLPRSRSFKSIFELVADLLTFKNGSLLLRHPVKAVIWNEVRHDIDQDSSIHELSLRDLIYVHIKI